MPLQRIVGTADRDLLERMIDRANLYSVLMAIVDIAEGKADHISGDGVASWAGATAEQWNKAGIAIENCAGRTAVRGVSL